MHTTWVVVADPQSAIIYSVPRGMARLRRTCTLQWPRDSMHSDAARPADAETGESGQARSPRDGQARAFAAQLAGHVEEARRDRSFDELILVAAPAFLAHLRESLSPAVRDSVVAEIAKNLVAAKQETLQEQVLRVL
jgi:protein required for attachment to host cells